jgi:hypothetical protein
MVMLMNIFFHSLAHYYFKSRFNFDEAKNVSKRKKVKKKFLKYVFRNQYLNGFEDDTFAFGFFNFPMFY